MSDSDDSGSINSTLFECCIHGDLDSLRIYLTKFGEKEISSIRDDYGATLAHYAARYGHVNILRYFVEEKHLDLTKLQTEHRASCAHDAAVCDQIKAIKYLLHYRHETNSPIRWDYRDNHGNTTLHLAASYGSINVLEYLLSVEKADPRTPGSDGYLPIHFAAWNGHDESVKCLLSFASETINAQTKTLTTPISLACRSGMIDTIQLLLSRGAQARLRDENGLLPLHWACFNGHLNIVKLLIETSNGQVDDVDQMNRSALHYASATDNQLLINYLLDRKAQIIVSNEGNTPLHVAAENGQLQTCLTLINRTGCSVSQINQNGLAPIDLAERHGFPVVANELRLHQTSTVDSISSRGSTDKIHIPNATVVRLVVKKRNIQRSDASNQVEERDLIDNSFNYPTQIFSNGSTSSRNLTNNRFDLSELRARVEEHEATRNDSLGVNNTVSDVLMHSLESLNQQNKRRSRAKLPTQTYAPWLKMSNITPQDFQHEIQKVSANLRKVRRDSETNEDEEDSERRTRTSQSMGPFVLPKSNSSTDFSLTSAKTTADNQKRSSISISKSHQFITPATNNGEIPQWRRALVERRRAMVSGGTTS